MCSRCGIMVPKEMPVSGTVIIGQKRDWGNTITIDNSSSSQSYYIKLKNSAAEDVISFFVRAGESATVHVPGGRYQVFFACGDEWFGPEYHFGDGTSYSKDEDFVDFSQYTITYTLYPVTDGNFTDKDIPPDEF